MGEHYSPRGKSYILRVPQYISLEMRSNTGFKEVRFKIRDYPFHLYQEMALYFFDRKVIDKPTIHEYARWCMKRVTDSNAVYMFQWKLTRDVQMQEQQNTEFGNR
jgi:hypothetical protein